MLVQRKVRSPLGDIFLVASSAGLRGLHFEKQKVPMVTSSSTKGAATHLLNQAEQQLNEYFRGDRKSFDVPLEMQGTSFQKSVWKALVQIPFGKTISYAELAQRIGRPKAFRAVGNANGKNPICIMVPCHRVIAADSTLGGYSYGLKIKTALLNLEAPSSHIDSPPLTVV